MMRKALIALFALALVGASFNGIAVAQEDPTVEDQSPDDPEIDEVPDDVGANSNGPPRACSLNDKTFCTNSTDV